MHVLKNCIYSFKCARSLIPRIALWSMGCWAGCLVGIQYLTGHISRSAKFDFALPFAYRDLCSWARPEVLKVEVDPIDEYLEVA